MDVENKVDNVGKTSSKKLKKAMALVIVFCMVMVGIKMYVGEITQRKVAPNKKQEILLVDLSFRLLPGDRNFEVKIKDLTWFSKYKTLFVSPDEQQAGAERFIWSKDSTKFLLVAKNLIIVSDNKEAIKLFTGEYLYLFYDLSTDQKWCNCSSALEKPFTFDDISNVEFEEVLEKPRTISQ